MRGAARGPINIDALMQLQPHDAHVQQRTWASAPLATPASQGPPAGRRRKPVGGVPAAFSRAAIQSQFPRSVMRARVSWSDAE